jgi:hypothetical protein
MTELKLCMYFRAVLSEPVEDRHREVVANMQEVETPFGWKNIVPPAEPKFGEESVALYSARYPQLPAVRCEGLYHIRASGFMYDDQSCDDSLVIQLNVSSVHIDYPYVLRSQFPRLISAFRSYSAQVRYGRYSTKYIGGVYNTNPVYNMLRENRAIDIDGRNNIFTLQPAIYWDGLLCRRALGYDRDEVIRRLQGQVPLVMPLMDGVYTVFNDNPDLTYDEFLAINNRFKPILGLI